MKTLLLVLTTAFLLLNAGCKKDSPTEPLPTKPPGYQEEVPWPSLANSPWPMVYGNPQLNGRSTHSGITSGTINWKIDSLFNISSGITVGTDSTIYVASEFLFCAYRFDGALKWKLNLGISTQTTPLVKSNGDIIVYYQSPSTIYAINANGEISWTLPLQFNISSQFNIGLDGVIYFIHSNTLYAVDNGNIIWEVNDSKIGSNINTAISPDGKFIYLKGSRNSIICIDLISHQIVWEFGKGGNSASPLIDSHGNIYISSSDELYNDGKFALFSFKPDHTVRWFFPHNELIPYGSETYSSYQQPAINKFGDFIFGNDTIYSVSYDGQLNWKCIPDAPIGSSIISDKDASVYIIKDGGGKFGLLKFDSNGNLKFETSAAQYEGESTKFSVILINKALIVPTQYKFIYSIK